MNFDRLRILAFALTGLVVGPSISMAPALSAEAPATSYQGLTMAQIELATWASGLFEEAGLELPPIRFTGHETLDECNDRPGRATYSNGLAQIHICTGEAGPAEEFLILHEIAHAWEFHNVSDERREDFLELRDLSDWHSRDLDWYHRGVEQAAEVMVWGLMDRPMWPARVVGDTDCHSLEVAYETLTGKSPLHGYTDHCD